MTTVGAVRAGTGADTSYAEVSAGAAASVGTIGIIAPATAGIIVPATAAADIDRVTATAAAGIIGPATAAAGIIGPVTAAAADIAAAGAAAIVAGNEPGRGLVQAPAFATLAKSPIFEALRLSWR